METIFIDAQRMLNDVSPLIFGHFCENAFDNTYGGIYDPGHPKANVHGHRPHGHHESLRMKFPPGFSTSPKSGATFQIVIPRHSVNVLRLAADFTQ
jgi:hypothetical protein